MRHLPLQGRGLKNGDELICKVPGIADFVETHRHIFIGDHAAKVGDVGTHDGNAVFAGLVSRAARSGGRIVWQYQYRCALEQLRYIVFGNVSAELDGQMRWLRVAYRLPVTGAGVMVGS